MQIGDRLSIPFGSGTKEGVVVKICEKSVWLKVDFPRHPGKLIRRKLSDLRGTATQQRSKKGKLWRKKES